MIKWGILGLGRMGNTFANAIKEVENSKLISVASKSDYKLSAFQKNFNIKPENKFKSYNELISSNQIDAVYISTLNNTHVDLILECAKKNKKILCEKPIGLNLNQANLALEAINKYNISFYEAIAYRSHPQTKTLLELIDSGEIGEVYKIEAYCGWKTKKVKKDSRHYNKGLGGGAILDLGSYPVSFSTFIASLVSKIDYNKIRLTNKTKEFCSAGVEIDASLEINFLGSTNSIVLLSFDIYTGVVIAIFSSLLFPPAIYLNNFLKLLFLPMSAETFIIAALG